MSLRKVSNQLAIVPELALSKTKVHATEDHVELHRLLRTVQRINELPGIRRTLFVQ